MKKFNLAFIVLYALLLGACDMEEEDKTEENLLDKPVKFNLYLSENLESKYHHRPHAVSSENESAIDVVEEYTVDGRTVICFTAHKYGEMNLVVENMLTLTAPPYDFIKIILKTNESGELSYSAKSLYEDYECELKEDSYVEKGFSPSTVCIYSYNDGYEKYSFNNATSATAKDSSMIDVLQVDNSCIKILIKKAGNSSIELYDENNRHVYSLHLFYVQPHYTLSKPFIINCHVDGGFYTCQFTINDDNMLAPLK